jgi:hypothetical protein
MTGGPRHRALFLPPRLPGDGPRGFGLTAARRQGGGGTPRFGQQPAQPPMSPSSIHPMSYCDSPALS